MLLYLVSGLGTKDRLPLAGLQCCPITTCKESAGEFARTATSDSVSGNANA